MPLLLGGFFFLGIGTVGLLRLPDIYTRMHATGKCDTLGAGLTLLGLIVLAPDAQTALKIAVVAGLITVINPTTAHVIANAAYRYGGHELPGTKLLDLQDTQAGGPPGGAPPAPEEGVGR